MQAINPAEDFLNEQFPEHLRRLVPSALRKAYATATRIIASETILKTPGGRLQRGDLIALACEYEIGQLVETGQLPFDKSWEPYARPTGLHLVVWTPNGRLTISQVEDHAVKPRPAVFRENYALSNTPFLFEAMNEEAQRNERKHLLLVHGYQELTFAHVVVPHRSKSRHIAYTPNLMGLPHVVADDLPKEEGPTESPTPEAIENLLRLVRDNNDE